MKVYGFNSKIASYDVPSAGMTQDDLIKTNLFQQLKNSAKLEEIIDAWSKSGDASMVPKIRCWAEEREASITLAVRLLNGLCDERDALMQSFPSYKTNKKNLQNLMNTLSELSEILPEKVSEILKKNGDEQTKAKIVAKSLKVTEKWAKARENFFAAYEKFYLQVKDNSFNYEPAVAPFTEAIVELVREFGRELAWMDLRKMLEEQFSPDQLSYLSNLNLFLHEKLEWAKQVKSYRREMLASRVRDIIVTFEAQFAEYNATKEKYCTSDAFKKYSSQKCAVENALRGISSFCSLQELENHPKLQNDAKAKLRKSVIVLEPRHYAERV